jgi:hypothetical protein
VSINNINKGDDMKQTKIQLKNGKTKKVTQMTDWLDNHGRQYTTATDGKKVYIIVLDYYGTKILDVLK